MYPEKNNHCAGAYVDSQFVDNISCKSSGNPVTIEREVTGGINMVSRGSPAFLVHIKHMHSWFLVCSATEVRSFKTFSKSKPIVVGIL